MSLKTSSRSFLGSLLVLTFTAGIAAPPAKADVTLESQTLITSNALHFDGKDLDYGNVNNPSVGEEYDFFFGRNISAHGDAVKTYKHYVFMTWYKGGKYERNVMLSRYNTLTGAVKTIEFPHRHTGFRGDPLVGESHNTIGLAVSPINGTIHMVYDMHAYNDTNHSGKFKDDYFRYSYSIPGAAEVPDADFTLDQFVKDTSSISQGDDDYKHLVMTGNLADKNNFASLTYPKFFANTDGTLLLYMRLGGNNNGAYVFNRYDAENQKWSTFTKFNHNNQKSRGNEYNWGLYGNMKYENGKLRVGFQQRSSDNTDKYLYQNGVYYAYSDHPEGFGDWKNHKGEPMTWPLVDSDEIKVFEPGDYITHSEANSVYIVSDFDWTVTAKGDIHIISAVRSTDRSRPDYQEVYLHSYKPAGAEEFITSTDFTGASEIYTAGDNVYIIGLNNGYPYVEKAAGGTNNFVPVYQQTGGTRFDHGVIHIEDGKLYYYLMERGAGNALPLYLQVIDLDIAGEAEQPVASFAQSSMTVEEGYQQLSLTVQASSPVPGREIVQVDLYINDTFIRTDNAAPYVWGHKNKPEELLGLPAGTHTVKAVVTDSEGVTGVATMSLIVDSNRPTVTFPQSSLTVDEGYEQLSFTVQAASPVEGREIVQVELYANDTFIRTDSAAPFVWGHKNKPEELLGLPAGTHTFTALATDSAGEVGVGTMTLIVAGKPVVTFPQETLTVYEGYEKLTFTIDAESPVEGRTIESVTLYINGELARKDTRPIWNFGHQFQPHETGAMGWLDSHEPNPAPLGVGVHTFTAVAVDNTGFAGEGSMTLIVEEVPAPSVSFAESEINLAVGYEHFSLSVNAESAVSYVDINNVALYLDESLIREIYYPPYTWGDDLNPGELLGVAAGVHTLKAVATDSKGKVAAAEMTFNVMPGVVSVDSEVAPYIAENLFDGDTSDESSWSAAQNGTKEVVADLGESKVITGTKLWTTSGQEIKYEVYVSDFPDSGFVKVAKHQNKHDDAQPTMTNFSQQGRYVKLKAIGDWPNINEFEILFQD
ncbi:MAG: hypothetical protein GYB33_00455 [Gammaproteobacteria bacterium]|nr:hypothetical protein [Gammaproteobacteria bacterium]